MIWCSGPGRPSAIDTSTCKGFATVGAGLCTASTPPFTYSFPARSCGSWKSWGWSAVLARTTGSDMTVQTQIELPKLSRASRPRTVAILESSAKMGGIQHTTLALAANLHREAWNPIVICPEEGELTRACQAAGVEVRTLPVFRMCSTSVWINNQTKLQI